MWLYIFFTNLKWLGLLGEVTDTEAVFTGEEEGEEHGDLPLED